MIVFAARLLQRVAPQLADRLSGWLHVRAVERALAYQRGQR